MWTFFMFWGIFTGISFICVYAVISAWCWNPHRFECHPLYSFAIASCIGIVLVISMILHGLWESWDRDRRGR